MSFTFALRRRTTRSDNNGQALLEIRAFCSPCVQCYPYPVLTRTHKPFVAKLVVVLSGSPFRNKTFCLLEAPGLVS
jgi:hypothetical protein